MTINNCKTISLPLRQDPRGNLCFVESNRNIPFEIKRVYYIYNVPKHERRASHAHKELSQLAICLSGSLEIILDDGFNKKTFLLSDPSEGLLILPGIWRDIHFVEKSTICMCLADRLYSETDYIREYKEFKKYISENNERKNF